MAASDLEERLKIPSIELTRLYQIDKIQNQYRALGQVLGVSFHDDADYQSAKDAVDVFRAKHSDAVFSVGECMNGDPFELALALTGYGFRVAEIFGTVQGENFGYLKRLAAVSPDTRVYSNMEPTMLYYDPSDRPVTISVGKDAGYYHPESPVLSWNSDVQPYGYAGLRRFMEALSEVLR
jgi:nitrogenase molybdenum-cofactor synthesis protein NifE